MPVKKSAKMTKSSTSSRTRSSSRSRSTEETIPASPDKAGDSPIKTSIKTTASKKNVPAAPMTAEIPAPNTRIRHSARIQQKLEQQHDITETVVGNKKDNNVESPFRNLLSCVISSPIKREPLVQLVDVRYNRHLKSKDRFFGGLLGTLILIFLLPCLLIGITLMTSSPGILRKVSPPQDCTVYFDRNVALVYTAWILAHALFSFFPIGQLVMGPWTHVGEASKYRCNGIYALCLSIAISGWIVYNDHLPITYLYDHWIAIATTLTIFSIVLALLAYLMSFRTCTLSIDGYTGWWHYDFFMGRELNSRILGVDLKSFCSLRAGLITWFFLDVVCLFKDLEKTSQCNPTLIVLVFFHFMYVADAVYFEEGFLITPTISHEGFGYLLSFGSIAWVPILFSTTTRFLVENPSAGVPDWVLPILFLVNLIGFVIYRGSNSQKNDFKRDPTNPSFSGFEVMTTGSGKFLVGGWWGWIRHPNYLGDLIMAIAWSSTCGCHFLLPWAYPLYLFIFLLYRMYRDERLMVKKHTRGCWNKYKKKVPSRLIPRVF